jgi:AbrB family looped-hinge helix DNA binding protein
MTTHTMPLSRKGQVTIPAEIRQALGLKEGDRVTFIQEGDRVRIERTGSVVERTAGMLKGPRLFASAEEERAAFEMAVAEEVAEEMNRR